LDNVVVETLDKIQQLELDIQFYKDKLSSLRKNCKHIWGDPIYDPITHDYTSPLTREISSIIYKGSDDRWKRTCLHCGLTESTTRVKVTKTPNFELEDPGNECQRTVG
jgi:hypothetical protein